MSKKKKEEKNIYAPLKSYAGYNSLSQFINNQVFTNNQIAQNTHAELCPVCKGSGKYVEYHFARGQYTSPYSSYDFRTERTCHGCGGTGWVVISTVYGIR